ncbi:hypothetical protein OH710_06755 [Pseudomonas capsici]|uniref:hypothetical protein n=1 Tax=Pseudomonas capsici TaxID=2810614 RepID=UPI0021F11BBC|nr:hypothetical protein [Pseudomonas capsici]MCV4272338.1 hypothetical protein [Pseudomonas capsici]
MQGSDNSVSLKYFGVPSGYLMQDPANIAQSSTVASLVYDILGGQNQVTPLLDLIMNGGKSMAQLNEAMADENQWIPVHDSEGNPGYEVSGGATKFLMIARDVPDSLKSQLPDGAISKYVFVNTFNTDLNTSMAHGVGFYVVNGAELLTSVALTSLVVGYMKNMLKRVSQIGSDDLPDWDVSDIESADQSIQDETLEELNEQIPDISLDVSIDTEMTEAAGLTVTDIIGCACTGLIVGIVLFLIFYVINFFLITTYIIRFAVVNLSSVLTLRIFNAYDDNVDQSQLPDILGKPEGTTNIIPSVNRITYYDENGSGGIIPDQPVMHIAAFQLTNDNKVMEGLGCLLNFIQYVGEGRAVDGAATFSNLYTAYEVHRTADNAQGLSINEPVTDVASIYNNLTSDQSVTVTARGGGIKVTQMTNALSGVGDDTYDVVLIIEDDV